MIVSRKSSHHQIFVTQERGTRYLRFGDGPTQGAVQPADPVAMVLPYTRYLPVGLGFGTARSLLMIGLGAGSLPRLLRAGFSDMRIDVVEIDPDVVEIAKEYFFVREDPLYRIRVSDGRAFVKRVKTRYDMVVLDAFCSGSIPYHLTTLEFYLEVKSALTEGGILVSNMVQWTAGGLYRMMLRTLREAFGPILLFPVQGRANVVVVGRADGTILPKAQLSEALLRLQPRMHPSVDLKEVAEACSGPPAGLDDVPVLRDRE